MRIADAAAVTKAPSGGIDEDGVLVPAASGVREGGLDLLDNRRGIDLFGLITPDFAVPATRRRVRLGHVGLVSHEPRMQPRGLWPAVLSLFPLWITCFRRAPSPRKPAKKLRGDPRPRGREGTHGISDARPDAVEWRPRG